MNRIHANQIARCFAMMLELAERASNRPSDEDIPEGFRTQCQNIVVVANGAIADLGLAESESALRRLDSDLEETNFKNKKLHIGLTDLAKLMQSELGKLHVLALEKEKVKFFREESFSVDPLSVALGIGTPPPLFSTKAHDAFPDAFMDVVEAGRCLALNRNNAAVYHLMQVAEVGLRALAWDRRVVITTHHGKTIVPLDFAQWGQIIGALENKWKLIDSWPRAKPLKEQAKQYYSTLIFEVSSFNEIYRKHISHARSTLYETDTAISERRVG